MPGAQGRQRSFGWPRGRAGTPGPRPDVAAGLRGGQVADLAKRGESQRPHRMSERCRSRRPRRGPLAVTACREANRLLFRSPLTRARRDRRSHLRRRAACRRPRGMRRPPSQRHRRRAHHSPANDRIRATSRESPRDAVPPTQRLAESYPRASHPPTASRPATMRKSHPGGGSAQGPQGSRGRNTAGASPHPTVPTSGNGRASAPSSRDGRVSAPRPSASLGLPAPTRRAARRSCAAVDRGPRLLGGIGPLLRLERT